MRPLPPNPVVIDAAIKRHPRLLTGEVDETIPAGKDALLLIADASARRPCVSRLWSAT